MLDQMGLILLFQDHICLLESLFHVTAVQGIGRFLNHIPFGIDLRGLRLDRLLRIEHKGKDLVINLDQIQGILRRLLVHGCHSEDLVAYITGRRRKDGHRDEGGGCPFRDGEIRDILRQ